MKLITAVESLMEQAHLPILKSLLVFVTYQMDK